MSDQKKISLPKMTLSEKAVLIQHRVKQLNNGYKTTIEDIVKEKKLIHSYDIAIEEFILGKLPDYEIKRKRSDGSYEIWKHEDFVFFPDQNVFEML
jgi:DNA-directed RNA polymerase subunit K/omega